MTINRSDLRTAIREILRDFFDVDTTAASYNSSVTSISVSNISRYRVGDIVINAATLEQMRVERVDKQAATIGVVRGANGTTAASGLSGATLHIVAEYSDRAINYAINSGIADTYRNARTGSMGIWIEVIDTTLTTSLTTREYTIPSAFTFIRRIEILDENSNYQETTRWKIIGTKIVFDYDAVQGGKTIRISGMSYQALLSSDATNFTLTDEQVEFVKYSAILHLIEMRIGRRIKATEYSASVNDRAGQPSDLSNFLSYIRSRVDELKAREEKPMMSGFLKRPKR